MYTRKSTFKNIVIRSMLLRYSWSIKKDIKNSIKNGGTSITYIKLGLT